MLSFMLFSSWWFAAVPPAVLFLCWFFGLLDVERFTLTASSHALSRRCVVRIASVGSDVEAELVVDRVIDANSFVVRRKSPFEKLVDLVKLAAPRRRVA